MEHNYDNFYSFLQCSLPKESKKFLKISIGDIDVSSIFITVFN